MVVVMVVVVVEKMVVVVKTLSMRACFSLSSVLDLSA